MLTQLQLAVAKGRTANFMILMVADQLDIFADFGTNRIISN